MLHLHAPIGAFVYERLNTVDWKWQKSKWADRSMRWEAWKCNFPPFSEIMTDRPTNQPTRRTNIGRIGKLHYTNKVSLFKIHYCPIDYWLLTEHFVLFIDKLPNVAGAPRSSAGFMSDGHGAEKVFYRGRFAPYQHHVLSLSSYWGPIFFFQMTYPSLMMTWCENL